MPPALDRKYWGEYLTYNGGGGSVGTHEIMNVRDSYVAYNDCSNCNRQGLDGGVIESWGTGGNTTWEYNALHDNEGYGGLSLFFADDFSPGTTIRKNLAFENNCPLKYGANCAVFMVKSSNLTVEHNTVADSNYSRVFEVAAYRMPASNQAIVGNLLFNTTQRRLVTEVAQTPGSTKMVACQGGAAAAAGVETHCDSYYTTNACGVNTLGPGLCYHNSTLGQLLAHGDGTNGQRSMLKQYGFDAAQLAEPVVSIADRNFVDEPLMLHVGTCDHFDTTSTPTIKSRPFKAHAAGWHSRTALDYGVATDSPLRQGANGFEGLTPEDVQLIGLDQTQFPFDLSEYKKKDARDRLQAENYDRTKGLWTMQANGLGTTLSHFEKVEPKDLTAPGSWARYDAIDFSHMKTSQVNVQVRAQPMAGGATVLFLLGSPEVPPDWRSSSRLLASVQVPSIDAFDSAVSSSASSSEWPLLNGTAGPAIAPDGTASVFMVFVHKVAAPTPAPSPPHEDDMPHRYWRITTRPEDFNASLGPAMWDVCELELYANYSDATAAGTAAARGQGQGNTMCTDPAKAICSSDAAATRAQNAFDGVANCTQHDGCGGCKGSMWRSASSDRTNEWLGYDFGAAAAQTTVVRAVRLKQFPNQYCSGAVSLQFSDDNVGWQTKWRIDCTGACPNDATASESLGWTLSSLQAGKNVAPAIPGGGAAGIGAVVDWFSFSSVSMQDQ
jgi:hypothetical protein